MTPLPANCRVECTHQGCDATVHITSAMLKRDDKNDSGECARIHLICEEGHKFVLCFDDHSGSLWVTLTGA
jgi:hypothetical protein